MTTFIKNATSASEIESLADAGPVVVFGLPASEYDKINAVRSTLLKDLSHAPAYCFRRNYDPEFERGPEQRHFAIGRAVHCMVLEPDEFGKQFYLLPEELEGRSKAAIEAREELEAANAGKTMIKQSEIPELRAMAAAALCAPRVGLLLARGEFEVTIVWRDEQSQLLCKARPDYLIEPCEEFPNGLILDLKTTADASPFGFRKSCGNYEYPMQIAHYGAGVSAAFGTDAPVSMFLAVEKDDPYLSVAYVCSQQFVERGEARRSQLMAALSVCIDTGEWPGYASDLVMLDAPAWYGRDNNQQEF